MWKFNPLSIYISLQSSELAVYSPAARPPYASQEYFFS
nr:MAG TPA: hypothetical protein [Caudoviricetes sp.]